jgi:hypothetical protein
MSPSGIVFKQTRGMCASCSVRLVCSRACACALCTVQEDPDVLCDDLSALIDTAHARGPLGPEDNARLHDLTLRFYACTNFMLHPSSILLQRFPHVSRPTLQNPYPVVCGTNIVAELSCHPGACPFVFGRH